MAIEVVMPRLGITMTERTVVKWLKKVGDQIKKGDVLFGVETDKVTQEVNAAALLAMAKQMAPAVEKKHAAKATNTDWLVKATATALREHPRANAAWADGARSNSIPGSTWRLRWLRRTVWSFP
jgi:pyruvate/2-oxoglutarate dehydrogenase complex dihydrolipoamide acyltransferase (E2) component